MAQTEVLGTRKQDFRFTCWGVVPAGELQGIALEFIRLAGMTPARRGRVDHYPYQGRGFWGWMKLAWWMLSGKKGGWGGGEGYTLYQPLMESFLIADIYTDIGKTEILLSTCKPERVELAVLVQFLARNIGPVGKDNG
jgi:hypothetical protein